MKMLPEGLESPIFTWDEQQRPVIVDSESLQVATVLWVCLRQIESDRSGNPLDCMALGLKLRTVPDRLEDAEVKLLEEAVRANGRGFGAIMQAPVIQWLQRITDVGAEP